MREKRKYCKFFMSLIMASAMVMTTIIPSSLQVKAAEEDKTKGIEDSTNLLKNAGFETGDLTGWVGEDGVGVHAKNSHSGTYGFWIDSAAKGGGKIFQEVTVPYTGNYLTSGYISTAANDGVFSLSKEGEVLSSLTLDSNTTTSNAYRELEPVFLKQGDNITVSVYRSENEWINGDDLYFGYDFENIAVNLVESCEIGEIPVDICLPWDGDYKFESVIAAGNSEITIKVASEEKTIAANTSAKVSFDLNQLKKDDTVSISVEGSGYQIEDSKLFLSDDSKMILVNGEPLEGFEPNITEYTVTLNENVKPNVVLADKESFEWVRTEGIVQQAESANGTATVKYNGQTYTIKFTTEDSDKNFFYLSDLDYTVEKLEGAPDDALKVTIDQSRNQHGGSVPLDIFSQTYEKGLGVHSGAKLSFDLKGQCTRFVGALGESDVPEDLRDDSRYGVIQVKVYLDDELVDTVDLDFRKGNQIEILDLDLTGSETLTFECLNGNGYWYDDYLAIADAKVYMDGESTEPENMEILFDGEIRDDFKFDPATEEYIVYVPEGSEEAPDVSVVDKNTGKLVPAFIKQAGADKVTYNDGQTPDKVIDSIGEVPDSAVLTIAGLTTTYRIRFVEDGEWRNITGEWYDYTQTYEMREPSVHDYSQTLTMKVFCAKPDNRDQGTSQVAYKFDEVLELIKKVDNLTYGIPKIVYLVGWQYTGHDDRYPSWDVVNENLKCNDCNHKNATECLSNLMLEAKKYNTSLSLHINSTDSQMSSPLWDRYADNDLISKKNGSYLAGSVWGGERTYKINYTNEWNYGFYKARVDRLCEMLPIEETGTIHSDAFFACDNDESTLEQEQEARRKMIRYWRSKGVDLTTEFLFTRNGNEEIVYNGGSSEDNPIDTFLGEMPLAWHYNQPIEEFMKLPATLIAGGTVNTHTYTNDREAIETLIGTSMHGEDLFTNYDANPVYARSYDEWGPEFIKQFCQKTVPYFYLNQFDRQTLNGEGDNRTVTYSDGVMTAIEDKKLTRNGVTLRENGNIFIPISWKENTIIAFSENGYTDHEWTFPVDWTSDAKAVDIYNITKDGLRKLNTAYEIKNGKIKLTLEKNQAVIIVPEGSETEYVPGEFTLTGPENGGNVLIESDSELTWEKAKDAQNYKVVVAKDAKMEDVVYEGNTVNTTMPLSNFKDKLETDSKYYWKVFASVNKESSAGIWNNGDAFLFYTDVTKEPEAPSDFKVNIISSNKAELTWTDPSDGANEYEIYRKEKTESDDKYQLLDTIKGAQYVDEKEFDSITPYSYRLIAKNSVGSAESVYAETNSTKWLEFENADSYSDGLQAKENDEGIIVGNSFDGASFLYNKVDFENVVPDKVTIRYSGGSSCESDSRVEIRLDGNDGELLATVNTPPTGDWNNYTIVTTELEPEAGEKLKGTHTISFVLKGSGNDIGDYNWIAFEQNSRTVEVDKSELQNLYDSVKDLKKEGYTKETWDAFVTARDNAKAVLDNSEATQEEVNTAVEQLQSAVDGLRVSKTTLKYYLDEAKKHVENGDVDNTVESIQKLFDEAIKEGEAVMEKENATKEEVMNATLKLIKAIQSLDMKPGDKADLEMTVELADMLDLNKYVAEGQQEFKDALTAAKAVLNDEEAMQEDIDAAWNALVETMSNLRLKANKEALKDLLEEVEELDLSKYTDDSVAAFEKALAYAKEIMSDETLAQEDQKTVDEAVEMLKAAKEGLVEKSDNVVDDDSQSGSTDKNNNTIEKSNNQKEIVQTGDSSSPIGWGVIGLIAVLTGGATFIIRRKRA